MKLKLLSGVRVLNGREARNRVVEYLAEPTEARWASVYSLKCGIGMSLLDAATLANRTIGIRAQRTFSLYWFPGCKSGQTLIPDATTLASGIREAERIATLTYGSDPGGRAGAGAA